MSSTSGFTGGVRAVLGAAFVFLASAVSASAQSIIDEVRFGGTWAQPHILDNSHPEQDQFGINAELLFTPFVIGSGGEGSSAFVQALATPRLHIGGLVNFDEHGTDYIYSGLTWQFLLTERLFLETGLGMSLNNGKLTTARGVAEPQGFQRDRAALGSHILFREAIALGLNVTENATLVFQVEHSSHAHLFDSRNRGLTNASLRFGYKF